MDKGSRDGGEDMATIDPEDTSHLQENDISNSEHLSGSVGSDHKRLNWRKCSLECCCFGGICVAIGFSIIVLIVVLATTFLFYIVPNIPKVEIHKAELMDLGKHFSYNRSCITVDAVYAIPITLSNKMVFDFRLNAVEIYGYYKSQLGQENKDLFVGYGKHDKIIVRGESVLDIVVSFYVHYDIEVDEEHVIKDPVHLDMLAKCSNKAKHGGNLRFLFKIFFKMPFLSWFGIYPSTYAMETVPCPLHTSDIGEFMEI